MDPNPCGSPAPTVDSRGFGGIGELGFVLVFLSCLSCFVDRGLVFPASFTRTLFLLPLSLLWVFISFAILLLHDIFALIGIPYRSFLVFGDRVNGRTHMEE